MIDQRGAQTAREGSAPSEGSPAEGSDVLSEVNEVTHESLAHLISKLEEMNSDIKETQRNIDILHQDVRTVSKLQKQTTYDKSLPANSQDALFIGLGIAIALFLAYRWARMLQKKEIRREAEKGNFDTFDFSTSKDKHLPSHLKNTTSFVAFTISRHIWWHAIILFLPLLASSVALLQPTMELDRLILGLFGAWGILITFISAFYSSRADDSAARAVQKAEHTHDNLLNFAESFEVFGRRLQTAIGEGLRSSGGRTIPVDALTVIPAFGALGLPTGDKPTRLSRFGDLGSFSLYIAKLMDAGQIEKSSRIITHSGLAALKWIANIRIHTAPFKENKWYYKHGQLAPPDIEGPGAEEDLRTMQHCLEKDYLVQKCFAFSFLKKGGSLFVWKSDEGRTQSRRKGVASGESSPIPFQFFIVRPETSETKVHFLFSGDVLYRNGLGLVDELDLSLALRLSRGYSLGPENSDLVRPFSEMFSKMQESRATGINDENFDLYFPNTLYIRVGCSDECDRHLEISIKQSFEQFKEELRITPDKVAPKIVPSFRKLKMIEE